MTIHDRRTIHDRPTTLDSVTPRAKRHVGRLAAAAAIAVGGGGVLVGALDSGASPAPAQRALTGARSHVPAGLPSAPSLPGLSPAASLPALPAPPSAASLPGAGHLTLKVTASPSGGSATGSGSAAGASAAGGGSLSVHAPSLPSPATPSAPSIPAAPAPTGPTLRTLGHGRCVTTPGVPGALTLPLSGGGALSLSSSAGQGSLGVGPAGLTACTGGAG